MSVATLMAPLAAWAAFQARPGRHYWLTLPIAVAGLLLLSSSTHWGVSLSLFWFLAAAATLGFSSRCTATSPSPFPLLGSPAFSWR